MTVTFRTDDTKLQAKYEAAIQQLRANVMTAFGYDGPVLAGIQRALPELDLSHEVAKN